MTSKKANFGTALRMVDLILLLEGRKTEMSVSEAADELGVHTKTIIRYVQALHNRLVNDEGEAALSIVHHNRKPYIQVSAPVIRLDHGVFDYASLFFAAQLLGFTGGSQLRRGVERVADRLADGLPGDRLRALHSLRAKFAVYSTGSHANADTEVLSDIISALVNERRLNVRYRGWDEPKVLEPLSLVSYKEGLYLLVRKNATEPTFTLSLPHIEEAEYLTRQRYDYPADWSPDLFRKERFGIMPGKAITVALRFRPHAVRYVQSRSWSPTQSVSVLKNGEAKVTMKVNAGPEFLAWICSFGPDVVVEKPRSLRDDVVTRLHSAMSRYLA